MGHKKYCAAWIFLTVAVFGISAAPKRFSTAADIQYAANMLKVELIVGTNHELGGSYKIAMRLTNTGQRKILSEKDWSIMFHHRNKIVMPAGNQEMEVVPAEGCLYVVRPKVNSKFNGFNRGESQILALDVEGLLLHKTEFFPNFAIYASQVPPRNILSTMGEDLSFVSLAPFNTSLDDVSRLSGIQRIFTWPDIVDNGRVSLSYVIPAPYRVVPDRITEVPLKIIDLQKSPKWNILFDEEISPEFRNLFIDTLSKKPNMTRERFSKVTEEKPNEDLIKLNLIKPNEAKYQEMTSDGYSITFSAKSRARNTDQIEISAKSNEGIFNAFQSMVGLMGKFTAMPEIFVEDDARFQVRSVGLDLTKNLFSIPVLKQFIDLLAMYKLNHLILNLADDHAWRLEMEKIDFDELHTFASKRCIDQNQCLPPLYGAGADGTQSSSGYITAADFKDLVKYASVRNVRIIPKINYLGGLRSAIEASARRYDRLKGTNPQEAERLYLSADGYPESPNPPDESCYTDGVLNPCIPQTEAFIELINKYIHTLYKEANVTLLGIHAGGDDGVKLYETFKECKNQQLSTPALLEKMVYTVQKHNPTTTLVNEEAMIDPTTNDCLPPQSPGGTRINQDNLVIVFHRDFPGNPADWGLTPEEEEYLYAPIEPPPAADNATANAGYTPDYLKRFTGTKSGRTAPWAKPYTCANSGYMIILNPDGYTNLESAYELDFDERGHNKKDRYFTINLHRMMLLEPYNIYINMDLSNDMQPLQPYRLCDIFECPVLNEIGKLSLIGLQASIDTSAIRTEEALWEMALPRLILHAEKAWREAPFENALLATDPATYDNATITEGRSRRLLGEMTNFLNTFGYKEAGRLDDLKMPYRIGRVGAAISFGLSMYRAPPFPIIVKTDFLGAPIQYRELHVNNSGWNPLFWLDRTTRSMNGGYYFSFPVSPQRIELRQVSSDNTRAGKSTILSLNMHNLTPKEIPVALRENACLRIREPYKTDLEDLTLQQWATVINNIQYAVGNQSAFSQARIQRLADALDYYRAINSSIGMVSLPEVMAGIEELMVLNQPRFGVYKFIYDTDKAIIDTRETDLRAKYDRMHQQYLQCPKGKNNLNLAGQRLPGGSVFPAGGIQPRGLGSR